MQDQDVAALPVGDEAFAAGDICAGIVEFVSLGLVALFVEMDGGSAKTCVSAGRLMRQFAFTIGA